MPGLSMKKAPGGVPGAWGVAGWWPAYQEAMTEPLNSVSMNFFTSALW